MVLTSLRAALFVLAVSILGACQRVPDWEIQKQSTESSPLVKQLSQYHRWLWTCRAQVGRLQDPQVIPPTGIAVAQFLDDFRRAGLTVVDSLGSKRILGTAVFWSADGLLVTLNHWLEGASEIECRNAEIDWQPATLFRRDVDLNVALLQISAQAASKSGRFGEWPRAKSPAVDAQLFVMASPFPGLVERHPVNSVWLKNSLQTGVDENLKLFSPSPPDHLAGGVLTNDRGEWLGFLNFKNRSIWGRALLVDFLENVVEELQVKGEVRRLYLGMLVRWVPAVGFIVQELQVDGAAYNAGIRLGDVIVRWNGKRLSESRDWPSLKLSDLASSVDIDLLRSNREVQIKMSIR